MNFAWIAISKHLDAGFALVGGLERSVGRRRQ